MSEQTNNAATLADAIADRLGETQSRQRSQIHLIVKRCGEDFARDLLAQTLEIEAQGGMMTHDGQRRRTPGGVFFYLAKGQMAPDLRKQLFPYPHERRKEKRRQAAQAAMPPDVFEHYQELTTAASELHARIDRAKRQGATDVPEADHQALAEAHRQINAIELEYGLRAGDRGEQSRM